MGSGCGSKRSGGRGASSVRKDLIIEQTVSEAGGSIFCHVE